MSNQKHLKKKNGVLEVIGDEAEEESLEEEEEERAKDRDVLAPLEPIARAPADEIPAGMETAVRGDNGESIEEAGEDLETGEN